MDIHISDLRYKVLASYISDNGNAGNAVRRWMEETGDSRQEAINAVKTIIHESGIWRWSRPTPGPGVES